MIDKTFDRLKLLGKLPNFVVVGAPKSGTTSLYHYLSQHSDIYLPVKKELHYFSSHRLIQLTQGPSDRYVVESICKTLDAYAAYYEAVGSPNAIGDISPFYLYHEGCAERIYKELGAKTRIIILLRHPIEKAYSQYMHLVAEGRETLSFDAAIEQEAQRKSKKWLDIWLYTQSTFYAPQVERFLSVFPREQIFICLLEDMQRDPKQFLQEVCEFLDILHLESSNLSTVYNRSSAPRSKWVARYFVAPGPLYALANKMRRTRLRRLGGLIFAMRRRLKAWNACQKEPLSPEMRERLEQLFRPDIDALESLLGCKL
ncbi:sulfotransferase [Nitrosococcus halophilus Nc 4]|uniref:Sulfotransferase n=1 Tax=Nitrosococcus halophilus (strain Nc4) TaxID=472759 RepID=D5C0M2_NITHN|nr:sulfotransferase [Nitrosococcus halophilus]ADE16345.1 sulfotransferase [Nitrosococcus halophilus Nc 4]